MHLALEVKSLDLQIMNKRPENYEKENDSVNASKTQRKQDRKCYDHGPGGQCLKDRRNLELQVYDTRPRADPLFFDNLLIYS